MEEAEPEFMIVGTREPGGMAQRFGMTFDQAMQIGRELRSEGYSGIMIMDRYGSQFDEIAPDPA